MYKIKHIQNTIEMAVTLNEITKYVKHNNSDIKFDINVVPEYKQPVKIPKR